MMAKTKVQRRSLAKERPTSEEDRTELIRGGGEASSQTPILAKKKVKRGDHKRLLKFPADLNDDLVFLSEQTGHDVQHIVMTILEPVIKAERARIEKEL